MNCDISLNSLAVCYCVDSADTIIHNVLSNWRRNPEEGGPVDDDGLLFWFMDVSPFWHFVASTLRPHAVRVVSSDCYCLGANCMVANRPDGESSCWRIVYMANRPGGWPRRRNVRGETSCCHYFLCWQLNEWTGWLIGADLRAWVVGEKPCQVVVDGGRRVRVQRTSVSHWVRQPGWCLSQRWNVRPSTERLLLCLCPAVQRPHLLLRSVLPADCVLSVIVSAANCDELFNSPVSDFTYCFCNIDQLNFTN